jgi:toxin ParE1/3/4
MPRRIRKRKQVESDLLEIAKHIADRNFDAAVRFLTKAEEEFVRLCDWPGAGPVYGFAEAELAAVRFWPIKGFRNHLIFYRPIEDGIEVIRVLHGSRDVEHIIRDGA